MFAVVVQAAAEEARAAQRPRRAEETECAAEGTSAEVFGAERPPAAGADAPPADAAAGVAKGALPAGPESSELMEWLAGVANLSGRKLSGALEVTSWLTAAIPMEDPYCSCRLTRLSGAGGVRRRGARDGRRAPADGGGRVSRRRIKHNTHRMAHTSGITRHARHTPHPCCCSCMLLFLHVAVGDQEEHAILRRFCADVTTT